MVIYSQIGEEPIKTPPESIQVKRNFRLRNGSFQKEESPMDQVQKAAGKNRQLNINIDFIC